MGAAAALADYQSAARPGPALPRHLRQRMRALTEVCNALQAGGVTGVGLWVANWSEGRAAAVAQVEHASGPYPVIGVQWANAGTYDLDVFSAAWVNARAVKPVVAPPPGQWADPKAWTWDGGHHHRHAAWTGSSTPSSTGRAPLGAAA